MEAATHAVTETLRLDPNYQRAGELANLIKQAHYNRGVSYLNDERYSEAITAFQNAIILDPDFTTAHYHLGLTYLKMETYSRAVDSLQRTVHLDAAYKTAHHALALAYLGQQELGKARDAARDALKLDPNYHPARSLLEAIDPSFTSPVPQAVTPAAPNQPRDLHPAAKPSQETHHDLGIAYKASKMYTEAIAEFQKAIDLDPNFTAAHTSLGEVYLEMGQLDAAETAANTALRIDANSQPVRQLLANIQRTRPPRTPHPSKSSPPVSTPSAEPPDVKQDLERGFLYLNNGQYHQATAAFKRVIKADPSSTEAHYGLGQAYLEIGAFDDAKTAADEVLNHTPNHQQARELLQVIRFARNMEKNRKIRKQVLRYGAIVAVIGCVAFVMIRFNVVPWMGSSGPPQPSIVASLEEPSENKFLDAGETARLKLVINNTGGTARNVEIRFHPATIAGVRFKKPALLSKLPGNGRETIRISMTADKNVKGRNQTLQIQLFGKHGWFGKQEHLVSQEFTFKILPRRGRH